MFELTGKTALITGATGGIGKAIAQEIARQGALLILSGTNVEKLEHLNQALGGKHKVLACNLQDQGEVEALFDQAEELSGNPVDLLICNAGVTSDNLALRMKVEEWQKVIDINLTATFILNKAAIKRMMRRKQGRIINISSVVATSGNPGQANYVASKAGMIGMTKSLAQEVASRGITVNCISPGFIATPMTDVLPEEQKNHLLNTIPAGRLGDAKDIASATCFLASDEAGYITGQTLHVNGGMVMV